MFSMVVLTMVGKDCAVLLLINNADIKTQLIFSNSWLLYQGWIFFIRPAHQISADFQIKRNSTLIVQNLLCNFLLETQMLIHFFLEKGRKKYFDFSKLYPPPTILPFTSEQ